MSLIKEMSQSDNHLKIIKYLQDKGIFATNVECSKCSQPMKIEQRKDVVDKNRWRCTKCGKSQAFRRDTFLDKVKISLQVFLTIVIHWALQTPQCDQAELVDCDRKTVGMLHQKLRKVACEALYQQHTVLGGVGKVVEIDESLFVKVKHHKGKDMNRPQIWIFGM
jgi:transposase-like protein